MSRAVTSSEVWGCQLARHSGARVCVKESGYTYIERVEGDVTRSCKFDTSVSFRQPAQKQEYTDIFPCTVRGIYLTLPLCKIDLGRPAIHGRQPKRRPRPQIRSCLELCLNIKPGTFLDGQIITRMNRTRKVLDL